MSTSTITSYPVVTVLMSVYNSEAYLREAVESMLNQSFKEFEFIIINDTSTDSSLEIIESYDDSRIKIIHNPENIGLTRSLNKGLKLARGKYIARMDADDVSLPDRLEKQVRFMEDNPEIGICGTWYKVPAKNKIVQHPIFHQGIITALFKDNAIGHPTSILRKEVITRYNLFYNERFLASQDYDLWVRAANVTLLANIPEVLVLYRLHDKQVSSLKKRNQKEHAFEAKLPLIKRLLDGQFTNKEHELYKALLMDCRRYSYNELEVLFQLLNRFIEINKKQGIFEPVNFYKIILEQCRRLCFRPLRYDLRTLSLIRASHFYNHLGVKTRLKLLFKSIIGSFIAQ